MDIYGRVKVTNHQKDEQLTERKEAGPLLKTSLFKTSLHFPMIPFGYFNMLPLLSLYMGGLMSSDPSLACTHPPCREILVAAPVPPGSGGGVGSGACEGQRACRIGISLPAIAKAPQKVEQRHDKVGDSFLG